MPGLDWTATQAVRSHLGFQFGNDFRCHNRERVPPEACRSDRRPCPIAQLRRLRRLGNRKVTPILLINSAEEGSGTTLATRKPNWLPKVVGTVWSRLDDIKVVPGLFQKPPRNARSSTEESFPPSKALSSHSEVLPF